MQEENGKLLNNHFSGSSWGNFLLPIQICNTCSVENEGLNMITVHLSYGHLKTQKSTQYFYKPFPEKIFFQNINMARHSA